LSLNLPAQKPAPMLAAIAGMENSIRREQPIFFQGIARGFISAHFNREENV
jgi:hypothetical protein